MAVMELQYLMRIPWILLILRDSRDASATIRILRAGRGATVISRIAQACALGFISRIAQACALGVVICALLTAPAATTVAVENGGLGPLSIRNQYPVTLGYLNYTPGSPVTIPDSSVRFRYQYSLTNTFINTQSPEAGTTPIIDSTVVDAGITAADFPATGYGVYLDVEAARHLIRFDYGIGDSLELGLELAWISFGRGSLDGKIQSVEKVFGGLNEDRTYSDQNRFDFYVIKDGVFIHNTSEAFGSEPQDPVFNLKWTLGQGGDVLPALSIQLSYKMPLESNPTGSRGLISSGKADYGYYILLGKAVADWVAHYQVGVTVLDVDPDQFSTKLKHRMFGLEFRINSENSLLVQSVSQTSLYLEGTTNMDFAISRQTDVSVWGYKHQSDLMLLELGFIEDYNQQRNESDITLYFELGWQW